MGSNAELYFDNTQGDWGKGAAAIRLPDPIQPIGLPCSFRCGSCRPTRVRSIREDSYFGSQPRRAYSVLYGSAAAAERRLSILGYSRSRAEEAWNSAKTEVLLSAEQDDD